MTPTPKLRFVKRFESYETGAVPVLQQWWTRSITYEQNTQNGTMALHVDALNGEWRDVPLEEET